MTHDEPHSLMDTRRRIHYLQRENDRLRGEILRALQLIDPENSGITPESMVTPEQVHAGAMVLVEALRP